MAAQSDIGQAIYAHYGLDTRTFESNILLENGTAWFRSTGSIKMIAGLGFPWSLVKVLSAFPPPLRDRAYELVANNRYRLFGKRDTCLLPDANVRSRFVGEIR